MKPIPIKLREHLQALPRMTKCERSSSECSGRIEWEHVFSREKQRAWQIIAICTRHHRGDLLNKEINRHIAYQYATDADLDEFKLSDQMRQEKKYLAKKY